MLKAILAKTIAAVRKVAQFVAQAALRVLRGIQPATPVNAFVASKRVVCGLRGAFFALLLMAASPLLSGDAYAHDAFAKECVEIGRDSSGIYPHYIRNLCDKTIKVGWCTHHSEGCDKFWGLTILGPGKKSHYIPTVDTNRRFTTTWGSCYHEQYYSDVVHIYPRTSGSEYICQHRHRNSNRSGDDSRSSGSSGSGSSQNAARANSCKHANDGECDEPNICARGTDTNDCANACKYANDGECDEPNICPRGTDANDCRSANQNSGESANRNSGESGDGGESGGQNRESDGVDCASVLSDSSITDLHKAARRGKTEAVRCMIENGADVNEKDGGGWTPLHYAARWSSNIDETIKLEIASFLLENGANVNAVVDNDWTPSDAAGSQFGEMQALLRAYGGKRGRDL